MEGDYFDWDTFEPATFVKNKGKWGKNEFFPHLPHFWNLFDSLLALENIADCIHKSFDISSAKILSMEFTASGQQISYSALILLSINCFVSVFLVFPILTVRNRSLLLGDCPLFVSPLCFSF